MCEVEEAVIRVWLVRAARRELREAISAGSFILPEVLRLRAG